MLHGSSGAQQGLNKTDLLRLPCTCGWGHHHHTHTARTTCNRKTSRYWHPAETAAAGDPRSSTYGIQGLPVYTCASISMIHHPGTDTLPRPRLPVTRGLTFAACRAYPCTRAQQQNPIHKQPTFFCSCSVGKILHSSLVATLSVSAMYAPCMPSCIHPQAREVVTRLGWGH
jgi:hypothetical protein